MYKELIELADEVNVISPSYTKFCFHKRNEYMVDKSDLVLVVWNEEEKAQLTFYTNKIKFNHPTAVDLGFPKYVQLISSPSQHAFGIMACEKDAENAVTFFNRPQDSKPYPVVMSYDKYYIVEEEAQIVRLIFKYYLNGYSSGAIADALTRSGVPTITGQNPIWSPTVVISLLRNEKYCGDVAMQKTFVENYLTHKTVKNTGQLKAYLLHNHHEPIVSKEDWDKVQELLATWRTRRKNRPRKQHKVITVKRGRFAGYIIIDPSWTEKL